MKYLVLIILFTIPFGLRAQTAPNYDSLIYIKNKDYKLKWLNNRLINFSESNPELATQYCDTLIRLAILYKNEKALTDAYLRKADALYYKNNLVLSATYYTKGLDYLVQQTPNANKKIGENYAYLAYTYLKLEQLNKALDASKEAVSYIKKANDSTVLADNYSILGDTYFKMGDYKNAAIYYSKTLEIDKKLGDSLDIAVSLKNFGMLNIKNSNYNEGLNQINESLQILKKLNNQEKYCITLNTAGLAFLETKNYTKAKFYLEKSYKLSVELDNNELIATRLLNLAILMRHQGDFKTAKKYLIRSINKTNNYRQKVILNKELADNYVHEKKYKKAIEHYLISIKIAKKHHLNPNLLNAYNSLSDTYYKKNDFKNALFYNKKYNEISSDIFTISSKETLSSLNILYETEKNETEIKELLFKNTIKEQENDKLKLQRATIFAILLALSFMFLFIFTSRIKKQKEAIAVKEIKINNQLNEIKILRAKIASNLKLEPTTKTETISLKNINDISQTPLSKREHEILQLIAQGYSNSDIAEKIFVSINTIKFHLKNIYTKLDVNNRIQASRILNS